MININTEANNTNAGSILSCMFTTLDPPMETIDSKMESFYLKRIMLPTFPSKHEVDLAIINIITDGLQMSYFISKYSILDREILT